MTIFAGMTWLRSRLERLGKRRNHRRMYVILDGTDNSVTLSKALYNHMSLDDAEEAKVFVFRVGGTDAYGFAVNPDIKEPTQLADIQYNSKYKCIGFETLNPTVTRMLYDYGLPAQARVKLSVEHGNANGTSFYKIMRND